MPCFSTRRTFLVPSFDLEAKEREKMERFLCLLEDSGVGKVIERHVKNNAPRGGRPGYNYYNLSSRSSTASPSPNAP